jgi:hypothetical protein
MTTPLYPLYADIIDTTNVIITDSTNASTLTLTPSLVNMSDTTGNNMALSVSSINFSDASGVTTLNTTSLNISTDQTNLDVGLSGKNVNVVTPFALNLSSVNLNIDAGNGDINTNSYGVNISSVALSLNATTCLSVTLPTGSGSATQVLSGDGSGYVKWLDFSALALSAALNIEAGTYINNGNISTTISFQTPYPYATLNGSPLPPVVLLTPDADGSGNIIPVSINGYNNDGDYFNSFDVIFGSSKLKRLNFVVLPTSGAVQDGSVNISTLPILESIPA